MSSIAPRRLVPCVPLLRSRRRFPLDSVVVPDEGDEGDEGEIHLERYSQILIKPFDKVGHVSNPIPRCQSFLGQVVLTNKPR